MDGLPRLLVVGGLVLVGLGLLLHFVPGLGQLGRLPGDIRIERPGLRFYFPITSGLLVSAVVSLVVWLVTRGR